MIIALSISRAIKVSSEGKIFLPVVWARKRKVLNSLSNRAELNEFPFTFATTAGTGLPFSSKTSGSEFKTKGGNNRKIKSGNLNFMVWVYG